MAVFCRGVQNSTSGIVGASIRTRILHRRERMPDDQGDKDNLLYSVRSPFLVFGFGIGGSGLVLGWPLGPLLP